MPVWHGKVVFSAFEILISKLLKCHFLSTNVGEVEELLYINSLKYKYTEPDCHKSSADIQRLPVYKLDL